ncbi:MAG: tetratricopeptide repeat protein [Acidobacteriota bacterium]
MSSTLRPSWRRGALTELRRARRHLLAAAELGESDGLAEDTLATFEREVRHLLGELLQHRRQVLSAIVPALRMQVTDEETIDDLRAALKGEAKLAETLLACLPEERGLSAVFVDLINADYAESRHLRARRCELGLKDVSEPRSKLLQFDTDCIDPPRFFLRSFELDQPNAPVPASVTHLEDHRRRRSAEWLERGHDRVASGDPGGALNCFSKAAGFEESADALTYQGWMHALLGNEVQAEQLCLRAIELDPEFGNPYNDIGTLHVRRDNVEMAIQYFEKAKQAKRYEPRHFPYINLGRLYRRLGMLERSLREFEGALVHDPGNAEAVRAVQDLQSQLCAE